MLNFVQPIFAYNLLSHDGVGKCELETQKEFLYLLGQRSQLLSNLRVLISSQPVEAVRTQISKSPKFHIQYLNLHNEDHRVDDNIDHYIDKQLDRLIALRGYSNKQTTEIKDSLKAAKCGLFLPIILVIQGLENSNKTDINTILRDLNNLRDLDQYYKVLGGRLGGHLVGTDPTSRLARQSLPLSPPCP